MQQAIKPVAQRVKFGCGHERRLARMRLVDGDDLLDAAGTRREHRNAVGQKHRLAETVGDENDGLARARQQHREILAQHHAGLLVERAERLVHQQDVGFQAERARQRRALAHAAGQLSRKMLGEAVEADRFQRTARALVPFGLRHALKLHAEHDVLEHRVPRKQRVLLEHEGEIVRHRSAHRFAGDGRRCRWSASSARR